MGSNRLGKYSLAGLVLITSISLTGTAAAKQCDSRYIAPGQSEPQHDDDYYRLDAPAIDASTEGQIEAFADLLDGRWLGTGIEVDCRTSNGESHSTITSYDIDAEIEQHFLGAIVLRAHKETSRKVKLETLFFSPEIEKQHQGRKIGHRSYNITFSEPNTMVFDEKYRVYNQRDPRVRLVSRGPSRCEDGLLNTNTNIANCSFQRMIHEIKTVTLENRTLTINRDLYVNGHFVAQQEWQLNKAY